MFFFQIDPVEGFEDKDFVQFFSSKDILCIETNHNSILNCTKFYFIWLSYRFIIYYSKYKICWNVEFVFNF